MDTQQIPQREYPVNIEDIMHTAYLQYSLSVNVGRAIPDVRDGLKPVNRRILYVLRQLGLTHSHAYSKCASVVGEVMGKYHPHGDQAIYDTLVRMAQDFAMRCPLIDGQGNFGSIDGDPPAAYRYTECRMHRLAEEMLTDLDKSTVDMVLNFDEKLEEPSVLPARFPNLLVNGATGIGVGMATNIPPHNLGEVIDATVHLIDNPTSTPRDLMEFIKGPDFPTGASIVGVGPIVELYETGHGIITMRAKCRIEETPTGGERIVVTEIPYAVNKEALVKKIAELVNAKVIPGISALHDLSSSRQGIKVVIDIKRNAMANIVLNQLYKHTMLQTSFGAQFLVVDRNRPRTLNLVQILQAYVDHRLEVITRRCRYELARAEDRAHILEGLLIAVDNIDEVVAIIRASRTRDAAAEALMSRFDLSKRQVGAILDMRLHQLTGLALEEVRTEYEQVMATITYLKDLLAHREKRMAVVRDELIEVRDKYADARRTTIEVGENEISMEDLIKRQVVAITVSASGYIKRLTLDQFRTQRRGGVGVIGMQTKDEDHVKYLWTACTHDYIMFFTSTGQMRWLKVYEIPEGQRTGRGRAIVNLLELGGDEQLRAMITVDEVDVEDKCLIFATRRGYVKKTELREFRHLRRTGIRAISIDDDDDLIEVRVVAPDQHVMLFSRQGNACRFPEEEVRPMGRTARGVIGMRLKEENDEIVGMLVVDNSTDILNVTANGMGKRSNIGTGIAEVDEGDGYRLTHRGSSGVISIRLKDDDCLVGALHVEDDNEIMLTTRNGQIVRFPAGDIRTIGRSSQGVRIMNLREGDAIISATRIIELEGVEDDDVDGADEPAEVDAETKIDSDSDTDTDADADADSDSDSDTDSDEQ